MKNRRTFPVVLVFLVAMLAAPWAVAEPTDDSAGGITGWWHGATAWIGTWLPDLARATAAAEEGTSTDDAGSEGEELVFTVASPGDGTQTESGPHWDPDG